MCLHLKIEYDRIGMYEFGLLTDNVEYHRGTEFLKADRLGSSPGFSAVFFCVQNSFCSLFSCRKDHIRTTNIVET